MVEITEIDDPRISFYRSLRYTPPSHLDANVFVAEGEKVVLRLLGSALKIHSIFAILEFYERYENLISSKMVPEEKKFYASKSLMEKIVGFHLHSGIMAIGHIPANTELSQLSNRIVALNKINNSENVGQIVRICRAFGFDSLLVDEQTTSPFLRRAVRVSMGNVFYLKVRKANNFYYELNWLKQNGYKIISCEVTSNSLSIFDFYFPDKFVLIFGNEDDGISSEVLKFSDSIIEIPIERNVDSLNVAVATAITLSEVNRKQRHKNVVN